MQARKSFLKVHPFLKTGKTPPKRDKRNIKLATVLKKPPAVPAQWDFDLDLAKSPIPTPVFANDWLGDCVIAGRAHMTIRFEYFEQSGKVLAITDKQVINEYKREGGSMVEGQQGLNMLDSLNSWRKEGWKAASKKYTIYAFTELDRGGVNDVKVAVRYLNGAYSGFALPNCWQDQFQRGQRWDVIPGPDGKSNPHNGHCVYICGYTKDGPVCITWGKKQPMTWKFFLTCCDEAYAVVDNRNPFMKTSPVDVNALNVILNNI
jgi:hypothetical protein